MSKTAVSLPKVPLADCEACSRRDGTLVPSDGCEGADILVVGEAPGVQELLDGRPFVGKSGQLLKSVLAQLSLESVYYTNTCLCYLDRTPTPLEVDCCRERLVAEIKQARPQLVVAAGAVAMQALLGGEKITDLQGLLLNWVDPEDGFEVALIPCFHPAALLRRPELFKDFVDALDKCRRYLEGQELIDVQPESFGKVRIGDSRAKAAGYIRSLGKRVSLDVETSGYSPYEDRLLCLGVSTQTPEGIRRYAFPWKDIDTKLLQQSLEDKEVVFYNGQFDAQFLWSAGVRTRIDEDPILQSYLLDARPGALGLKHTCRKYLNAPDWEEPIREYLPSKETSYEQVPIDVLLEYCSLDAAYSLALNELLYTYMDDDDKWVYHNILLPATNMFVDCSRVGIAVDVSRLERLREEYSSRLQALQESLRQISGLPHFNPRSVRDCRTLLYDVLKLAPIQTSTRPVSGYSTAREVLDYYGGIEAVQLLREFREKQKLLGTYLEGLLDDLVVHEEGERRHFRVHPNLKLFGTVTGRVSSNSPNMLGLPKEKGGIRQLFVADEGKLLVMMDFKAMELRVAAVLSGDSNMMDSLSVGRDFHQEARERLFGKRPSYTHQEVLDAKMIVFGPLYGRGIPSLARQLGCSLPEAQRYFDSVFAGFQVFLKWSDDRVAEAKENGEVRSYFGRKRRWGLITDDNLKDVEHEARNHPVQSTATDVNLLTMRKIYDTFDHDLVMPLLPIHDAILLSVDESRSKELIGDLTRLASTYPSELLQTRVPFGVEVTVGKEWV